MDIDALLADSGTAEQIKTWECPDDGEAPGWWCVKRAKFLGQVGNEVYWACGTCPGIFRTGAI